MTPSEARTLAGDVVSEGDEMSGEAADRLIEESRRLRGERERLGAVNLRAEEESRELGERLDELRAEESDVRAAIDKLRRRAAELNAEGRSRLESAFEGVRDRFESLFAELFGGGEATLELRLDADDPLSADLDVTARPPGKKTRSTRLLSGGERSLTSLALIFAAFLVSPSPLCVLDEADAALDDANVERFCAMLETIEGLAGTRFLLITHHPYTMARMRRLYGATMVEEGVSRVVSTERETSAVLSESASASAGERS